MTPNGGGESGRSEMNGELKRSPSTNPFDDDIEDVVDVMDVDASPSSSITSFHDCVQDHHDEDDEGHEHGLGLDLDLDLGPDLLADGSTTGAGGGAGGNDALITTTASSSPPAVEFPDVLAFPDLMVPVPPSPAAARAPAGSSRAAEDENWDLTRPLIVPRTTGAGGGAGGKDGRRGSGSGNGRMKRVAPLHFNPAPVEANPALRFDDFGSGLCAPSATFVSPLISAMMSGDTARCDSSSSSSSAGGGYDGEEADAGGATGAEAAVDGGGMNHADDDDEGGAPSGVVAATTTPRRRRRRSLRSGSDGEGRIDGDGSEIVVVRVENEYEDDDARTTSSLSSFHSTLDRSIGSGGAGGTLGGHQLLSSPGGVARSSAARGVTGGGSGREGDCPSTPTPVDDEGGSGGGGEYGTPRSRRSRGGGHRSLADGGIGDTPSRKRASRGRRRNSLGRSPTAKRVGIGGGADTSNEEGAEEEDIRRANKLVLRRLVGNLREIQHHEEGIHPWTKTIKLEELGTASSWTLLLLPYFALLVSLLLDFDSGLSTKSIVLAPPGGRGNSSCTLSRGDGQIKRFPITPIPSHPCTYDFVYSTEAAAAGDAGDASGSGSGTEHAMMGNVNGSLDGSSRGKQKIHQFTTRGMAFTSGPLTDVPPLSSSLFADALFTDVSSDALALVADGHVTVATVLLQRERGTREAWTAVWSSTPARLPLVCNLHEREYVKNNLTWWDCKSPRLVDVLFSLPGTAILTGEPLRAEVVLYYHNASDDSSSIGGDAAEGSFSGGSVNGRRHAGPASAAAANGTDNKVQVPGHHPRPSPPSTAEAIIRSHLNASRSPRDVVAELASSSSFVVEYKRASYALLVSVVRLAMLGLTFGFFLFWTWSMGLRGVCGGVGSSHRWGFDFCRGCVLRAWQGGRNDEYLPLKSSRGRYAWWECSWVLLPERRYLFLLIVFLMLVQNPLLAYMYYRPIEYGSSNMHTAADVVGGIGVHGVLFVWLCLIEGLGYHTATLARKRADQQRRVLQQRQAAEYLSEYASASSPYAKTKSDMSSKNRSPSSYYDMYGDVDGSVTVGASVLRMKHDPSGPDWADFLIPKLTLFAIGVASVGLTAVSRFPECDLQSGDDFASICDENVLRRNNARYISGSFVQLAVLVLWVGLIVRYTFVSAALLRRQPFLSTRPAQLAFRVLVGILSLGCAAVIVPFLYDVWSLLRKWTSANIGDGRTEDTDGYIDEDGNVAGNISFDTTDQGQTISTLSFLLRMLARATRRFPYFGTASSIGPGKIIYITVCCLDAAYIFLPSSFFREVVRQHKRSPSDSADHEVERYRRKDKRVVVSLCRLTHTWRVFPLPIRRIENMGDLLLSVGNIQGHQEDLKLCPHPANQGRVLASLGRYTPVFCLEIACWLLECSWQAYYSPTDFSQSDWAPGRMSLESTGLKLEAAIDDLITDTHCFVCSNVAAQVDGDEDSIIVVAFRGSATATNLGIDLKMRQVSLPEAMTGFRNRPNFTMREGSGVTTHLNEDDVWDLSIGSLTPTGSRVFSNGELFDQSPSPQKQSNSSGLVIENDQHAADQHRPSTMASCLTFSKRIVRATPGARHALPCVHGGFLEAYSTIRKQILEKVMEVLQRQFDQAVERSITRTTVDSCNPFHDRSHGSAPEGDEDLGSLTLPKIYITGHSLGGALGQLLALDLASNCELVVTRKEFRRNSQRWRSRTCEDESNMVDHDALTTPERMKRRNSFPSTRRSTNGGSAMADLDVDEEELIVQPPIAVYTYGSPRVGNHAFARLYKQRVPHTFRVCGEGDAFTSMPPVACCGGMYKHAGLEVALDEGCTGNTLVGPTVVETLFRFSKVRTSVAAHSLERYRDCLESALTVDELQEYYRGHGGRSDAPHLLPEWVTQIKRR